MEKASPPRTRVGSYGTQLVLNLAPVEFTDAEMDVGVLEYRDREQLAELRAKHDGSHIFRREGAEVLALPFVANAAVVGEGVRRIRLQDNLEVSAALIRNALINHLYGLPRKVFRYRPVVFLADSSQNLLRDAARGIADCPDWLAVTPLIEVEVRVVHFDRMPPFVGMSFNTRTRKGIERSCQELVADGFRVQGCYVGSRIPSPDSRICSRFCLQGRVESMSDTDLCLSDCRSGEEALDVAEAYLEPTWRAFDSVVEHVFGRNASKILQRLDAALIQRRQGPTHVKTLRAICKYFMDHPLAIVPGIMCRPRQFLSQQPDASRFPPVENPVEVVYVFNPSGDRVGVHRDSGLDEFGPYTSKTLSPTRPRLCVICQAGHRGRIEQFVRKFLNGLTIAGDKRSPFVKGFVRKYAFQDVTTDFFDTADASAAAYEKAVGDAIRNQRDRSIRYDLALVETEERFHRLHGANNPYLICKCDFMAHQIPVQGFKLETTALPDARLQYVLNNMGLASYAKLGGVPWVIKAARPCAHELVIGLGSANIGEGRLGVRERMVGITTVFTGEGLYCLSTLSQAVQFGDYQAELLSSLKHTVQQLSQKMNWQPKAHVRLVFHAFKPFKQTEEVAVKELMASLGDYDVDYAFLHVVEDHPYFLADEKQKGVRSPDSQTNKGIYAPRRGLHFRLSDREMLMATKGPYEVKRSADGTPRPLLLRLGRESNFVDLDYLARQLFAFTCHSWRTFFPAALPVTILYSELIARLLGQLATVPKWNSATMLGRIGETRWFL